MTHELILLCEPEEADLLVSVLGDSTLGPEVSVFPVWSLEDLATASRRTKAGRLIAFCTPIIVPGEMLSLFDGPAYNFHPGPPTYPGIFPSVFAINDGAGKFGVTAHEMNEKPDSGAIVAVDWVDMSDEADRLSIDILSHDMLLGMFGRLVPLMADSEVPLTNTGISWGEKVYTRRDFEALCLISPDIAAADFERLLRAVGEGPDHALTVQLHGRRFRLMSDAQGPVVRGGQVI